MIIINFNGTIDHHQQYTEVRTANVGNAAYAKHIGTTEDDRVVAYISFRHHTEYVLWLFQPEEC